MAGKKPSKYAVGPPNYNPGERTKGQKRYFFLGGKLYRIVKEDKGGNLLTAWDYDDNRTVTFILTDAKRRMKNAYDTREVAAMLNRSGVAIRTYVGKGIIASPKRIHYHRQNAYGHDFNTMKWCDADILALHEHLLTNGAGRPRNDGVQYAAARIPNRQELLAILRNQPAFYMKTASGEFVPVWSAYNEV